jgi:selenocysteine lyase/cysteine desulfurase
MHASLDLLLDTGIEAIERHVLNTCEAIARGMRARGWTVVAREGEQRSALVSATHPELTLESVRGSLLEQRVVVTVRDGFLRVSPHLYTTTEDVERLLDCLA